MRVHLEPHNPAWVAQFGVVKASLQQILQDVPILSIEHVGSTSIPGLLAKPILDIDIICKGEDVELARKTMVKAGYVDRGEMGVPGRVAFKQPDSQGGSQMQRNTYVVVEGCLSLKNHLDLRKVLLSDKALRDEYAQVKRELSERGVADIDEYCRGKDEILLKILSRAGWTEEELEELRKRNE